MFPKRLGYLRVFSSTLAEMTKLVLSALLAPGFVVLDVEGSGAKVSLAVSANEAPGVILFLHGRDGLFGGTDHLVAPAAHEPTQLGEILGAYVLSAPLVVLSVV